MSVISEYEDLVYELTHREGDNQIVSLPYEWTFNFEYNNLAAFREQYLDQAQWLALKGPLIRTKDDVMPRVTRPQRSGIYEKERYERDMILNDLKFATHIMMSKYKEPIESRRFMATNDSCLSFVQVTVDQNNYRWVFVSRSTEVNKMLPADLYTIGNIIERWTEWFTEYNSQHYSPTRGIRISFMLNNPHYYK
jgi:hypothetical protein